MWKWIPIYIYLQIQYFWRDFDWSLMILKYVDPLSDMELNQMVSGQLYRLSKRKINYYPDWIVGKGAQKGGKYGLLPYERGGRCLEE